MAKTRVLSLGLRLPDGTITEIPRQYYWQLVSSDGRVRSKSPITGYEIVVLEDYEGDDAE